MDAKVKVLVGGAGSFGLLLVLLFGKMLATPSQQLPVEPVQVEVASGTSERLSRALTFPTISQQDGSIDEAAWSGFHEHLETSFPRFFGELDVERVNRWTIHAKWKGTDTSQPPLVVMAHTDVVPIAPGTEGNWTEPPFSGKISNGYIWGRGAIDDKQNVLAYLEATEALLASGHKPTRTIHFVFGHDEEIGGHNGAKVVSEHMKAAGIRPVAVYDEGLVIADGLVPGVPGKAGLIGISEKGYVTLMLEATGAEGLSSRPPADGTAVAVLAQAITRLEGKPFTRSLEGPAGMLLDAVGPEARMPERLVFTNRWLLSPVITRIMGGKRSGDASLRTTIAPTMLEASVKENVLPGTARAHINFRIHPRDSVASVKAHVEKAINDPRVTVSIAGDSISEPAPVSPVSGHGYETLQRSYGEVFPGMPIAPGLFIAMTDSRHFNAVSDAVYRFQPVPATSEDLGRIHGTDERIAVEDYENIIRLYTRLLVNGGQ